MLEQFYLKLQTSKIIYHLFIFFINKINKNDKKIFFQLELLAIFFNQGWTFFLKI